MNSSMINNWKHTPILRELKSDGPRLRALVYTRALQRGLKAKLDGDRLSINGIY